MHWLKEQQRKYNVFQWVSHPFKYMSQVPCEYDASILHLHYNAFVVNCCRESQTRRYRTFS